MRKRIIHNLGSAFIGMPPGPLAHRVSLPLSEDIYGIRIGANSEIDECYLVKGSWDHPAARQVPDTVTGSTFHGHSQAEPDVHLISVARPHLGIIEKGDEWIIAPSRVFGRISEHEGRGPRLELELLTDPREMGAPVFARAPASIDITRTVNASGRDIHIPTAGRRYASIDWNSTQGSGADVVVAINSITWYWDPSSSGSIGSVSTPVVAAVTGSGAWEGETLGDALEIVLGVSSAGSPRFNARVRLED